MNFFEKETDLDDLISEVLSRLPTGAPRMMYARLTENLSYEECIKALYAVLDLDGIYYPELNINNRNPKENSPEFIFPQDIYALGITDEDSQRVTLTMLPEDLSDNPGTIPFAINRKNHIIIFLFNDVGDERLSEFLKNWRTAIAKRRS
ncbi:MAG: hypothetical protein IKE38_05345 [Erysipelotrichaceae bacterium]|nr:hypothetical protein [Erysipelotrichaceae bacterium]